jgi:hypothetical protein
MNKGAEIHTPIPTSIFSRDAPVTPVTNNNLRANT